MPVATHVQKISEEQIEALRKQYSRIKYVNYNGVELVFRKPHRHECQDHAMKLENPAQKIVADEQLAQLLVVQCGPAEGIKAKEAFLALLDDFPYLVRNEAVGSALAKLTGVVQDEEAKNYGST